MFTETNAPNCVQESCEKHIELDTEICNLEIVEDRLKALIARISGSDCCVPECAAGRNTPSLHHVLITSANTINLHNNAMHSLIDELTEILF